MFHPFFSFSLSPTLPRQGLIVYPGLASNTWFSCLSFLSAVLQACMTTPASTYILTVGSELKASLHNSLPTVLANAHCFSGAHSRASLERMLIFSLGPNKIFHLSTGGSLQLSPKKKNPPALHLGQPEEPRTEPTLCREERKLSTLLPPFPASPPPSAPLHLEQRTGHLEPTVSRCPIIWTLKAFFKLLEKLRELGVT